MSTTTRMRAFVAVAETGSVRAAALRLVLTESSVSASIAALARDVGVDLVRRDGRGLRLTAAGERYAADARTILGLHEQALRAARGEDSPASGGLRIGATTAVGEFLLPEVLAGFRVAHPDVELDVSVVSTTTLWEMLGDFALDMAIGGPAPTGLAGVSPRATRRNTLVVFGAPELARSMADAGPAAATWLLPEKGSGIRATCVRLLQERGLEPPTLTLGTQGAVIAGAQAGLGVALVPCEAVLTSCATGRLVEIAVPWAPEPWIWQALTHERPSATTELFVRHLVAVSGWTAEPAARRIGSVAVPEAYRSIDLGG